MKSELKNKIGEENFGGKAKIKLMMIMTRPLIHFPFTAFVVKPRLALCLVNKFYEEGKVQNDDTQFVCEIRMDELKVLKQGFGWLMNG